MIEFTVEGTPRPQGSKRHVGKGIMVESSKHVGAWRDYAKLKATMAMRGIERIEKPVAVLATVEFIFDRPKKHFRTNGELRLDAPEYHTVKPDAEKCMRALCDAITGVCFFDDSQVAVQVVSKRYGMVAETRVVLQAN